MPTLPAWARANRVLLKHVVRQLAGERGIGQFLDLGSGVPTVGNVHEVAQAVNPDARVVYVDIDPVAVAHARVLLAGNPLAHAALADLRDPAAVLAHPLVREEIDWDQPVAVLMFAVLHFIPDGEQAERIVREFMAPCAPGSLLALSHGGVDQATPEGQQDAAREYAARTGVQFTARTVEQIAPWLTGLEVQPPGLADMHGWLPDLDEGPLRNVPMVAVLARKPEHQAG
jgi:hypothetical protein